MLQVQAFTIAMTSSPPHVVSRTRETSTVGFAMLRSRLPLRARIDFGNSWKTSTASFHTPEKLISIAPMVGCLQISPRTIWRISKPSMLRLALPWKSRCMSPLPIAVDSRQPSPPGAAPLGPHSSSLRGFRRSDRPRSPSHDRSRSRDAFSGHPRPSRRSHERYEERVVPSDAPAHRRRPRSRDSPSPRQLDFPSKSPLPRQKRFASQRSPSSSRERFASRGSSSPKRMRVTPDAPYQERFASRRSPSSPQERFSSRRSPASSQERFASWRSP